MGMKASGKAYFSTDKKSAFKIALIYMIFSGCWILFSDQVLYFFVSNSHLLTKIQTIKGGAFVLVTSLMVFILLQKELKQLIQVRQRLNESEEKYRTVVNSSPDLLYRTDMEGRVVFVSPSVRRLTGYSVGEVLGMNMARDFYLMPKERENVLQELQENGFVKSFEARLKRKDGTIWWASTNAHYYRDGQDNILGVEGVTRDVTRKKASEQALLESEQQLRAIWEANPDPMVAYDLKGYPLQLNPAFTKVFGWTFDELKGRRIPFVPEDQEAVSAEKIHEIFEKGLPLSFETRRLTKDQRSLDIILSAAVIKDRTNTPYGMVVNLTNISDKKRLEAEFVGRG